MARQKLSNFDRAVAAVRQLTYPERQTLVLVIEAAEQLVLSRGQPVEKQPLTKRRGKVVELDPGSGKRIADHDESS